LFASALVALAGSASAALVISTTTQSGAFAVSSTDLLQTSAVTGGNSSVNNALTINGGENGVGAVGEDGTGGGQFANLTNGTFPLTPDGRAGGYVISGGTLTYNFDTSLAANSLGYNISNIGVFAGWSNNGRNDIYVTVSYATVADPTTFLTLGSTQDYGNGWSDAANNLSVVYSDSLGGSILTGIKSVRFDFGTGQQENGGSGYKELDITGTAIPEPSAALLGGLGALALLRRRRA
jgi:hypothetical protein